MSLSKISNYERGQWAAFNRVLHWINEQEYKLINKADLYHAVMDMRPKKKNPRKGTE